MKRTIISVSVAMCFACAAYGAGDVPTDWDTQIQWSYGAMADTMGPMRKNCEVTYKDEFLEIGNWARDRGAKFSLRELVMQCTGQSHPFHTITRDDKHKCEMPSCVKGSCSETKFTAILLGKDKENNGCDIYISALIENHNKKVAARGHSTAPGTYVVRETIAGRQVFRISDVVLPADYYKNGKINQAANQNAANTNIYDVTNGTVVETGLHTCTADMFMDIEASENSSGNVRGAFTRSYILPDVDLTNDIYDLFDNQRGNMRASVVNMVRSRQGGMYDIKAIYSDRYALPGQKPENKKDSDPSLSNGVLFEGCVGHLDWLGHVLYGMNRADSVAKNYVALALNATVNEAGVVGAVRLTGDDVTNTMAQGLQSLADGTQEPEHMQAAWDYGSNIVTRNKANLDYTFVNTRTKKADDAYEKARAEMVRRYPGVDASKIKCRGNCNWRLGTNDVVSCHDDARRIEFVFQSICGLTATGQ